MVGAYIMHRVGRNYYKVTRFGNMCRGIVSNDTATPKNKLKFVIYMKVGNCLLTIVGKSIRIESYFYIVKLHIDSH